MGKSAENFNFVQNIWKTVWTVCVQIVWNAARLCWLLCWWLFKI